MSLVASSVFDYNAENSITALNESTTASMIADYSLGYDADQELTQQIDHGNTTSFGYDALGELTSYGTASQAYDAGGNRDGAGVTVNAGNEVTYDGTDYYAYDQAGNETLMYNSTSTASYTYDNENHMTSADTTTVSGMTTTTTDVDYEYDAFGNEIEEVVVTYSGTTTTATTQFAIDAWNPAKAGATGLSGNSVLAQLNGGGTLVTHYLWGDQVDQLIARFDAGGTLTADSAGIYLPMSDQNGSIRDILNSSGTIIESVNYDAFGNVISPGSSFAYVGRYTYDSYAYDDATGYYDNNARVYDPATGRWMSQDPMGFDAGDSNLYRYVKNSPMDGVDESGLFPDPNDIDFHGLSGGSFGVQPSDSPSTNSKNLIMLLGYWPNTDIGIGKNDVKEGQPYREGMLYPWRSLQMNYDNSGYDVQAFSPAFEAKADSTYPDGSSNWGAGKTATISSTNGRGAYKVNYQSVDRFFATTVQKGATGCHSCFWTFGRPDLRTVYYLQEYCLEIRASW